jgi:hypothetical protein
MAEFRKIALGAALMLGALMFGFGQAFAADLAVTKTPWCGCCASWIEHMRQSGFDVTVHEEEDLNPLKAKLGIEPRYQSCHTGEIEGYFIEGHVPAEDVLRLLSERPEARGLSVPGMPAGSPGMEMGSRKDPYDVLLIKKDGTTEVFAKH